MIDHIIFISYLYFFLFSTIGFGIGFSNLINHSFKSLDLGWYGILGFFLISIISIFSSFIFPHDFYHNSLLHLIGLLFFFKNFFRKDLVSQYKYLIIISFTMLIGAYVFKNHDDFSYYHLTYSLNLSENSFIVGTGNFSHGFRTFSNLFYYHSTLYMPLIEYYLFHIGPFYLVIFFNFIIFFKLFKSVKLNEANFIYYFLILSLIFVNIVFYRIGEHGTDRSAQILLLLIFYLFIETFYFKKKNSFVLKNIFLIILLITFAAGMKAIYYLYFLLIPILLIKKNFLFIFLKKENLIFTVLIFISVAVNFLIYYLNTGCFLYPAEKTCILMNDWSIPKEEVKIMSIHYEWWAKAGGGAGYAHELPKDQYVVNFVWLENWIDKHFFNKVSDTLFGMILICSVIIAMFFFNRLKKLKSRNMNNYYIVYILILIFLLEWFFNHPSMRYGGYVLIALPLIIFSSSFIEKYTIPNVKARKIIIYLFIISLVIFNIRNVNRINKEIEVYGYEPFKSPFFYVEDIKSNIVADNKKLKIYKPINNSCWASKTPCSYEKNLKIKSFLWMNMIVRTN